MEQQNQQPMQEKTENKLPIKTNTSTSPSTLSSGPKGSVQGWKYIAIAVAFALLAVGGILLFAYFNKSTDINPTAPTQCNQLGQEIDILIKQANYCEVDEDCVVAQGIVPGSPPCSCLYAVNKDSTDFSELENASQSWYSNCGRDIVCEPCAPLPQFARCEQNQCVGIRSQDDSVIDTSTPSTGSTGLPQASSGQAWQTYRSDEFGFEVRYPDDWFVEKDNLANFFFPPEMKGNRQGSIVVSVIDKANLPPPIDLNIKRRAYDISHLKTLRVVEWQGREVPIKETESAYEQYVAQIENESYIFRFSFQNLLDGEYDSVFDQILSTFRFVDQSP